MTKQITRSRRLTYDAHGNLYSLTIPSQVVSNNNWIKGQTLYLRIIEGILRYSDIEDPKAIKRKIQYNKGIEVYSIRVPAKIVLQQEWLNHQIFLFDYNNKGFIQYNPYLYVGSKTLNGVAEVKNTGLDNLPIKNKAGVEA